MGDRRPEQCHYAVTGKARNRPLVAVNGVHHALQVPLHEGVDLFRIGAFGKRGEAHRIGKQHRNVAPLALEGGSLA